MSHYKSNLRDIEFNLFEVLGRDEVLGTGPFEEVDADTARVDPRRGRPAGPRGARRVVRGRRPQPAGLRPGDRTRRRCPSRSRRATRPGWTPSGAGSSSPAELGGQPAPRTLDWSVAELVLGANPPVWMYASGPSFATIVLPQRQRARQADRPAHDRAAVGRHHGAHRAGRRLRRRRRPHQGHPAGRRHLAHRGRQAVHHLRRARHDREHHPPRARPPGRRRGRRRPGHQGPVAVHRAEVPLRPRDRRADRRAQRRLRHQRRAQDGHQGLHHLRAHLRRRTAARPRAGCSARCTTASRRCSRSSSTPG